MATILANGLIQFSDSRILYSDTPLTGQDFMELQELLPKINPVIGRSAMVGFPFISGGGGGAGTPGARGADGAPGPQGVTGPSMGIAGATGVQGPQGQTGAGVPGPTGVQGGTGVQGVQGQTGAQGTQGATGVLANDIFAADRVVDPAGAGTDTTLVAAIAALPATGGEIFLKAGAYVFGATVVLPNKNVTIRSGGEETTFTAPSGLPLFSVAGGFTGKYEFSGFHVVGDNSVGQALISLAAPVDVVFEDVSTVTLRDIVDTSTTPDVSFSRCDFTMSALSNWAWWRGTSTGGTLQWEFVESTVVNQSTTGIAGAPDWTVTGSYVGGGPLTSLCVLGRVEIQGFRADKLHLQMTSPGCRIVNYFAIDGNVEILNAQTAIANSVFTTPTLSGSQMAIEGPGGAGGAVEVTITGCVFDGAGVTGTNEQIGVNNVQGVVISGCSFNNNGAGNATDANIEVGATGGTVSLTVVGCSFTGGNPVQALREFFGLATITGRYDDNLGFSSALIGSNLSTVNDIKRFGVTAGTTTAAPVTQFTHTNTRGLLGIGTIKNTGGVNSLDVTETVTDAFGTTSSTTTTVTPGNSLLLDEQVNIGTAFPPYVSYAVSVVDTVAGNHTTFNLQHASTGSE